MRDHSVYKHGLILTRDNFLITGNNLHLTIGNNKNVIVAVGVIIFGTAPVFFNIGNRSSEYLSSFTSLTIVSASFLSDFVWLLSSSSFAFFM